jgi:hypothetical protein
MWDHEFVLPAANMRSGQSIAGGQSSIYPDSVPTLSRSVASLRVASDELVPADVTELLGREPTFAYARGDELSSKQGVARVARFGLWSYAAPESTPGNLDEQVAAITAELTADLDVWRRLAASFRVDLFCGLFLDRLNEGLSISPASLNLLADRGIKLDLDIYGNFEGDVNATVSHTRYHEQIEALAHHVTEEAAAEGWLTFLPEDEDQSPLKRSVNDLARNLRFRHYDGDGCVDH